MKKITLILAAALLGVSGAKAQESTPLVLSGSVDTYYKYDFSGEGQIPTSFNEDHHSFSLGMVNLIASKEVGKASFVADLSFGPRGVASVPGFSIDTTTEGNDVQQFGIQNLYVSYALSDVVSVDMGYMGTFVGYEVISPVDNFNYSTSYLFTNGPFQNAGLKLNVAPSESFDFMVGVFNDINGYSNNGKFDLGAQVHVAPSEGIDIYVNYLTSGESDSESGFDEIDLTAGLQLSDEFYLGVNAAKTWSKGTDRYLSQRNNGSFWGVALYPQYAVSEAVTVGLRYEHFVQHLDADTKPAVNAITASANVSLGQLTLIPEFRVDMNTREMNVDGGYLATFSDADAKATKTAAQIGLAAVYSF